MFTRQISGTRLRIILLKISTISFAKNKCKTANMGSSTVQLHGVQFNYMEIIYSSILNTVDLTDCHEWLTWLDCQVFLFLSIVRIFTLFSFSYFLHLFHCLISILNLDVPMRKCLGKQSWWRPGVHGPLEFVFQEQSYSTLHSGQILAWNHIRGDMTIPAAPSPISAELSPIPAALSRSLRRSAATQSPMRDADRCATL